MARTAATAAFNDSADLRRGDPDSLSVPHALMVIGGTSLVLWVVLWRLAMWALSILG